MATGKNTSFAWELQQNLTTLTKPRTDLIALFILSILKVGTVNLVKIAIGMGTDVQYDSNYRRLQRFINEVRWCWTTLIPMILKWSGIEGPITLIIDRTNWKLGKANINILCISVLNGNHCIPLIWTLLDKRGNSSQQERIDLMKALLSVPNLPRVKVIIGDREFIGIEWLKYLKTNNINCLIRLKSNMEVTRYNKTLKVSSVIKGNTRKGSQCDGKQYWLKDIQIFVHGFRYKNDNGKLEDLIVASFENDFKVSDEYSKRWHIEVMFKNFKSKGFNIESTHVTNQERLCTLFGLLTLGYICAINAGKVILKENPEMFKIANNGRPKISLFKAGFDELLDILLNGLTKRFNLIFKFL